MPPLPQSAARVLPFNHPLHEHPLCRESHLGLPMPSNPHAIAGCLPSVRATVGYEENDPLVRSQLQAGYPRFVINKLVAAVFEKAARDLGLDPNHQAVIFPNQAAASRCVDFINKNGNQARVQQWQQYSAVVVSDEAKPLALRYWMHAGELITSRQAQAVLSNSAVVIDPQVVSTVKDVLAKQHQIKAEDVYLLPSGMAAIFTVHRMLSELSPTAATIQLGFPYVDTLRVQQKFGSGVHFFPNADQDAIQECRRLIAGGRIAGLFTEIPSNPLLHIPDLLSLVPELKRSGVPIVIDDTIATSCNIDAMRLADVIVTSLSKSFSGSSDVIAGAIQLNPHSPHYAKFKAFLEACDAPTLPLEEAAELANNCLDFNERVAQVNQTTAKLVEFLRAHPKIKHVFYNDHDQTGTYDYLKKSGAGFGGLFSIEFHQGEDAKTFFDNLEVCKGPGLGANFSLACLYTLLAHYDELDYVEQECGISRFLIRVSVGLEKPELLLARYAKALDTLSLA